VASTFNVQLGENEGKSTKQSWMEKELVWAHAPLEVRALKSRHNHCQLLTNWNTVSPETRVQKSMQINCYVLLFLQLPYVTVTVTEAIVLRPLLEDRGRITEWIRILVSIDRMKQIYL